MARKRVTADVESLKLLQESKESLRQVESFPYNEYLRSVMDPHVYTCHENDTVREVLKEMARRNISSAIVVDAEKRPVGILTERDVMQRVVAVEHFNVAQTHVSQVMTGTPVTLRPDNSIYRALSVLSSKGIKHLPLVEEERVVGIVTMRQLLKLRYPEPMTLIEQINSAADGPALKEVRDKLPLIALERLGSGRRGHDIVVMMSLINRDIHRRVLELVRQDMGEPPVPFCVYVTGSHGRLENLLVPDQDHGMVIADSPEDHQYDDYFIEYSGRVSEMLDQAGFVFCPGNIMCSNPLWRKSLTEWKVQVRYWFDAQVRELGRFCTVLFDAAPIYGDPALFHQMRDHAFSLLARHREVLLVMHEEEGGHRVPTGWLGRFITEKVGVHKGELELKRSGLIFVIEGIRILSLMHGIRETSTVKRINRLIEEGHIHPDDGEYFESAYHFLLHLALKIQIEKAVSGQPVDTFVNPDHLSKRYRETLRHVFKAVTTLQEMVGAEFGELIL
jgi:CBS domain-containing protein